MVTKEDIKAKIASMTSDEIADSIEKALKSAGVKWTEGPGGVIQFSPLSPEDYIDVSSTNDDCPPGYNTKNNCYKSSSCDACWTQYLCGVKPNGKAVDC